MPGYHDIGDNPDIADYYRDQANRWACHRCTKPTIVIAYTPPRPLVPSVFKCPHNQYAPHAHSCNCKHFEQIEGYDELWS